MGVKNDQYTLEVKGEDDVLADIVSRWGQQAVGAPTAIQRVTTRAAADVSSHLRPLQDD